jgi:hypothetical protein
VLPSFAEPQQGPQRFKSCFKITSFNFQQHLVLFLVGALHKKSEAKKKKKVRQEQKISTEYLYNFKSSVLKTLP